MTVSGEAVDMPALERTGHRHRGSSKDSWVLLGYNGRQGEEEKRDGRLCEGKPSLVVHLKDLLDGADVGRSPQVQPQVIFMGDAHDLLQKNK